MGGKEEWERMGARKGRVVMIHVEKKRKESGMRNYKLAPTGMEVKGAGEGRIAIVLPRWTAYGGVELNKAFTSKIKPYGAAKGLMEQHMGPHTRSA